MKKKASPSALLPVMLLGVVGALASTRTAVLRGSNDMLLVPRVGRLAGVDGSLPTGSGASMSGRNHPKSTEFRDRVLAPPLFAAIGVTSGEEVGCDIDAKDGALAGKNVGSDTLPVASGHMFAGVNKPGADPDDVGVGSRLVGVLVRLGNGAKGHTVVRQVVDAALLGVTIDFDAGDIALRPPQDAGGAGAFFD